MNADTLAPALLRRIARVAKAKNSGKNVTFSKRETGNHWNHVEFAAAIEGGPTVIVFTAAGEGQYGRLRELAMAEYTMLTRPKAPDVKVLRHIANSVGWRFTPDRKSDLFICEFCLEYSTSSGKIQHAADCPVPPFWEWVNSLEREDAW